MPEITEKSTQLYFNSDAEIMAKLDQATQRIDQLQAEIIDLKRKLHNVTCGRSFFKERFYGSKEAGK